MNGFNKMFIASSKNILGKACGYAQGPAKNPSYEIGKTAYQSLYGRDLLSFEGYTRNDIYSLLWITSELKSLQTHQPASKGKRVSLVWSNPITKASLAHACQQLKASLCCIHDEQLKQSSNNFDMLGRSLGSVSDVVFVDAPSWDNSDLEKFAIGSSCPVITVCSKRFLPVLAYAELFTLFKKYGFLRRLVLSWIGPGDNPMLNTYMTLLPTIGAHLRYFVERAGSDEYDSWEKGYKLASKFNTEIQHMDTVDAALYRSNIISTCFHALPNMNFTLRAVKEMDLEWSFLQYDSFKGVNVPKDLLKAKGHNLIFDVIANQTWIFQALVLCHTTDYTPMMRPPRFEGVD